MAGRAQQQQQQQHGRAWAQVGGGRHSQGYGRERTTIGQEPFLTAAASAGSPPSPSSSPSSPTSSTAFPPTPTASTYPSLPLPLAPPTSIYSDVSLPHPNPLGPQFPSFPDTFQAQPKPLPSPQVYGRTQGPMALRPGPSVGLGLGGGTGMSPVIAANGPEGASAGLQAAIRAQQQVRARMMASNAARQQLQQSTIRPPSPPTVSQATPCDTEQPEQRRVINPVKPGKEGRVDATLSAQRRPVQHQCHIAPRSPSRSDVPQDYAPESSRKPRHGGPEKGSDPSLVPVPCDSSDDPDAEEGDDEAEDGQPATSSRHARSSPPGVENVSSATAAAALTISPREILKAASGEPTDPSMSSPRRMPVHPNLFKGLTPKAPSATLPSSASKPLFPPQPSLDNEVSTNNATRFEMERQRERAWNRKNKADAKRERRMQRLGRSCSPALEGANGKGNSAVAPMTSLGQAERLLNRQEARSTRMSKGHSRTRSQPHHHIRFAVPAGGDGEGAQVGGSWRDWNSDHGYYDSDDSSSSSSSSADFEPFRMSPSAVGFGPISFDVPRNAVMWRGKEKRAQSVESGGQASSARDASVSKAPSDFDETTVELEQAAEDLSPLSNESEEEMPFDVGETREVGPPQHVASISAEAGSNGSNAVVGSDGGRSERAPPTGGRIWRGSTAGVDMVSPSGSNGFSNSHSDSNDSSAYPHHVAAQPPARPAHAGKRIAQQTPTAIETDDSTNDEEGPSMATVTASRRGGRGGARGGTRGRGRGGKTARKQVAHPHAERTEAEDEDQDEPAVTTEDGEDEQDDGTMDDETEEEWTPGTRGRSSRGGRGRGRGRGGAAAVPRRKAATPASRARGSKRDRDEDGEDEDDDHGVENVGSSKKKRRLDESTLEAVSASTSTSLPNGDASSVTSTESRVPNQSATSQPMTLLSNESRPTGQRHGTHGEGPEISMVEHNGRQVPSAFPPWPSTWHNGVFECRWELDNPNGQPCGATFVRSYDLGRHGDGHVNKQRDPKPHKCPDCDNGFSRRDALQRHCRTKKHGDHAPNRGRKSS